MSEQTVPYDYSQAGASMLSLATHRKLYRVTRVVGPGLFVVMISLLLLNNNHLVDVLCTLPAGFGAVFCLAWASSVEFGDTAHYSEKTWQHIPLEKYLMALTEFASHNKETAAMQVKHLCRSLDCEGVPIVALVQTQTDIKTGESHLKILGPAHRPL